jgi:hypothetical protein
MRADARQREDPNTCVFFEPRRPTHGDVEGRTEAARRTELCLLFDEQKLVPQVRGSGMETSCKN